jgi:mannose-6-phosphate isomerase-like protein (cupin superfamily)
LQCNGGFVYPTETRIRLITTLTDHVRFTAERWYKATIYQSEHMLVGVECLVPGQAQAPHMHSGHDKMYYVQSGTARFTIGAEESLAESGMVIITPADTLHSVVNVGSVPLIMLIAMAPEPK